MRADELEKQLKALQLLRPDLQYHGFNYKEHRTYGKLDVREVSICLQWIEANKQYITKSVRKDHSSYGWKHVVERWVRSHNYPAYVSNGSFIAAAYVYGLKVQKIGGPNAWVNISKKAYSYV